MKGPFGSDLKKELYVPKGKDTYKVYLQENILKQNNFAGSHYISKDYYEKSMKRYAVKEGDFIVTCDGTLGEIFQLKNLREPGIISSSLLRITLDKKKCDEKFFPYFFKSKMKMPLITQANNSVLKHLPGLTNIRNFSFDLPPLPTQKKIAAVLSALDDKIALNKKMNQKLERMAKRLYDYWFVQYDFPDKNGHPYKTTGGKMEYNPTLKREIPAGWVVAPISEFIKKNFNGEWGKEEASEDDIRVHCVRGADIVDMVDMPVRYIPTKKKDRILNSNDIIVEISGGSPTQSTGRATFVTCNTLNRFESPMTCSNFCQIIRLKDAKCASYFFEMWQKFYASDIFFNFEGKTSGIKNFQTDSFIANPWAHPPKEMMYKFDEMYQSFMKKKERLIAENQKLTTLRDKLLPQLMNGQVVVG